MNEPIKRWSLIRWRRESILDLYQMALGLFLLLSPWLFAYPRSTSRLDAWVSGFAVVAIGVSAVVAFSEWDEWLNLLLGAWLVMAPWVLGFTHRSAIHVSVGVGLVIAYLALLDLWLIHFSSDAGPGTPEASRPRASE